MTLLAGLAYGAVQQMLGQGADDPQIQMAEDAAAALTAGQTPESVVPAGRTDIAQSLAPYLVLYDAGGQALSGSGMLHGRLPTLPAGVFRYARENGVDRVTWLPEPGVRSATVVVPYGGGHPGYVLAGRSLRETERRIDDLGNLMAGGWFGTLIATLAVVAVTESLFARLGGT